MYKEFVIGIFISRFFFKVVYVTEISSKLTEISSKLMDGKTAIFKF